MKTEEIFLGQTKSELLITLPRCRHSNQPKGDAVCAGSLEGLKGLSDSLDVRFEGSDDQDSWSRSCESPLPQWRKLVCVKDLPDESDRPVAFFGETTPDVRGNG